MLKISILATGTCQHHAFNPTCISGLCLLIVIYFIHIHACHDLIQTSVKEWPETFTPFLQFPTTPPLYLTLPYVPPTHPPPVCVCVCVCVCLSLSIYLSISLSLSLSFSLSLYPSPHTTICLPHLNKQTKRVYHTISVINSHLPATPKQTNKQKEYIIPSL